MVIFPHACVQKIHEVISVSVHKLAIASTHKIAIISIYKVVRA